jgi:hypothetical protein
VTCRASSRVEARTLEAMALERKRKETRYPPELSTTISTNLAIFSRVRSPEFEM